MESASATLRPALRDLEDAVDDFSRGGFQAAETGGLERILYVLDNGPLASLLSSVLPIVDFSTWWEITSARVANIVGSGTLNWPPEIDKRVAMQIALCRALAQQRIRLLNFAREYTHPGNNSLDAHAREFANRILVPMRSDISRLTELRPVPRVLLDVSNLPRSGDTLLDEMLADAWKDFRDPAPKSRALATEKLWDAWERLKTVNVPTDKRASVEVLLAHSSSTQEFRKLLDEEARKLTEIGNAFHIRHFELDKTSLTPAQTEYLFHRLFALLRFILGQR